MNPTRIAYLRDKVALSTVDEPEWTFEGRHLDAEREAKRGTGRWLEGKRCLDVGCGGGLLSEVSSNQLRLVLEVLGDLTSRVWQDWAATLLVSMRAHQTSP